MKLFFLLLFAGYLPSLCSAASVTHRLDVRVARLDCAGISKAEVAATLKGASQLLVKHCGLRLRWKGFETIQAEDSWCLLPSTKKKRVKAVQAFTLPFRRANEISIFLLDQTEDRRMAWSHFDRNASGACDAMMSSEDQLILGSVFLTREAFLISALDDLKGGQDQNFPRSSVLLAHELVHALTQKGHPTKEKAGNLMADWVSDIGSELLPRQCDCLLQSPWVQTIQN